MDQSTWCKELALLRNQLGGALDIGPLVSESEFRPFAGFDLLAHKYLSQRQVFGVRDTDAPRGGANDVKAQRGMVKNSADECRELDLFFLFEVVVFEGLVHQGEDGG